MKIIPVALLGTGAAGRALLRRIIARDFWWAGREGFSLRLCALVDSTHVLAGEPLLDEATIAAAMRRKELGQPLGSDLPTAQWLDVLPKGKPAIIVDATRSPHTGPSLLQAVGRGHSVVLLNDSPLIGSPALFRTLTADRRTRFEAAVGAGFPIIEPLEHMLDAGEMPAYIDAILDPELVSVFVAMESCRTSSEIARTASPKLELALENKNRFVECTLRQALIISRCLGSDLRMDSIQVEPLGHGDEDTKADQLQMWMAEALRANHTLRYVARITRNDVSVGIREVPVDSPLANARGGATVAVWGADHEPMFVVSGPGKGANRSAVAALGDMLVLAREEDKPWRADRLARSLSRSN